MYNLFYAANNENNAQYGYVLMKDKIVVKENYQCNPVACF